MKAVYTLAAILLAANVAAAADNGISEFHHHAMGGKTEVTPHATYVTNNTKATSGTTTKSSGFNLGVTGERGVAERLGVGADLSYTSATVDRAGTKSDVTGINDVKVFAKGSSVMGSGTLAYGATLGLSLVDAEVKANNDATASTGGMSLNPYVGYEMGMGPGVLGGNLSYNWLGERTVKTTAGDQKTEDGHVLGLAAFYEYAMGNDMTLGAALHYNMAGATKTAGASNNNKENEMGLDIYAPMKGGDNLTLIPRLQWNTTDHDAAGTDSDTDLNLGVAARWTM